MTMIISHSKKFCFVHIPKCGGSSIRNQAGRFDETGGRFRFRLGEHPELGHIQFGHLPLRIIRDYYPDDFEAIRAYRSFALSRDPKIRFRSALAERCRTFLDLPIDSLSPADLRVQIDLVIDHMERKQDFPDAEFCHFTRQTDFISLDGEQIVGNVFPVEKMDQAIAAMCEVLSTSDLRVAHDHSTLVFRNRFVSFVLVPCWHFAKRNFNQRQRNWLRAKFGKAVAKPISQQDIAELQSDYVADFLNDFYRDDIALHQSLMKNGPISSVAASA